MRSRPLELLPIESAAARERIERSLPFVTEIRWPAHERWTPGYLKSRCRPMQIFGLHKGAAGEAPVAVDVREMIDILADPARRPAYHFDGFPQTRLWIDGGPHDGLGVLLDDISFPACLGGDLTRLLSVNLWLRHGPYENPNHYDPNGAHNLNVQIAGTKTWQLFHPDLAFELGVRPAMSMLHPPLSSCHALEPRDCRDRPGFDEIECLEATVGPGQAIFVPAFWIHSVAAPRDELTTSVNFWWSPEAVPLRSLPASWAFMNALVDVFRRRRPGASLEEICADIRALGDEARSLLGEIEEALLYRPALLRSETALALRRDGLEPTGR
jgi:hypothetical protein